jgi:hypothetical protein
MRKFYAKYGRWPIFERDPDGRGGVVMEGVEETSEEPDNREPGAAAPPEE